MHPLITFVLFAFLFALRSYFARRRKEIRAKPFATGHRFKIIYNLGEQFSWSTPVHRATMVLGNEILAINREEGVIEIPYSKIKNLRCQFGGKSNLAGHTISIAWDGQEIYFGCIRWSLGKFVTFNVIETVSLFEELKKKVPSEYIETRSKFLAD